MGVYLGRSDGSYGSIPKNLALGAAQGAIWGGAYTLNSLHKNNKALKIVEGAKDNFEKSGVLRHVSSDSITNLDTYFVNGTKNSFISAKIGTKMDYNAASSAIKNQAKAIKKNAPKNILRNAGMGAAILGGIALLRAVNRNARQKAYEKQTHQG